jgi:catechol 2,3-dioxygenase-like lactoylglutathione lyase family enzyme
MLRGWVFSLVLACATLAADDGKPLVTGVDSIGITVSDLDRSVEFYSKVLLFEKVSETEVDGAEYEHLEGVFGLRMRTARMRLGGEFIELTEFLAPRGRPFPGEMKANDVGFQHIAIITSDMARAYQWLRSNRVQYASSGPQRLPDWNKNAAGIQAFYFRDPDGHFLEVLAFPPDKGDAKWHATSGANNGEKLFLGIDHTAIVISNTDASLRFYRDVLGLHVVGESENYGTEQEHLNNVFGAHLRITSLRAGPGRAATGPGVEFLEYLAPGDGLRYPPEEKANDLIHWQTRFVGPSVSEAAEDLQKSHSAVVSSGVVQQSIIVRDPDGHAIQFVQR